MAFIPGEAWRRPDRVMAYAARTGDVKEMERDLQLHALVALQVDARVRLTCDGVLREALQQLRLPQHAIQVTRISTSTFLLRFQSPALRNSAYARRAFDIGHTRLHLMPWGRQNGAAAQLSKSYYRVRVCLEGVPDHAHQVESVLHLLPSQSFVEGIDYVREKEDEKGCFILWIWCQDPDAISVLGTLQIEEPMTLPEEYYHNNDQPDLHILRAEELSLLRYEVLIHLDCVEDYHPPTRSPSNGSPDSDTSGLPSDEAMVEWPIRHHFVWHLGQPDAIPEPPRLSVHSRLGSRRDRSPPGDGGAGGSRQMPPPNQYDTARFGFGGAGPSRGRVNTGNEYHGRTRSQELNIATDLEPLRSPGNERMTYDQLSMDPMLDEAALPFSFVGSQPMLSQRSVEPTATERVMPDMDQRGEDTPVAAMEMEHSTPQPLMEETQQDLPTVRTRPHNDLSLSNIATGESLLGNLFDLNVECAPEEDGTESAGMGATSLHQPQRENRKEMNMNGRVTLGPADGRLNKVGRDSGGPNHGIKGAACFAVPLKRALLCTPAHKPKTLQAKKKASQGDNYAECSVRKSKMESAGSLDDRATALLIKTSGIIEDNEQLTEAACETFRNQFVMPMQNDLLLNMRDTFGLPDSGGVDALSPLICEADGDDA
ncbi:unnamed protein product [Urochloa decumbens]|uniref:Uncharacterized protein n=1 Tax=Urochloa decumbens TaxID=240449 RepID=A0ABC9GJL2_9POAL